MKLDTDTLGTLLGITDDGAHEAANALSRLSGIEIGVDSTSVSIVTEADLRQQFPNPEYVGVTAGLNGAFAGETLLVFERAGAENFVEGHRPPEEELDAKDRSSVKEAATIAARAFSDSLAAHFDESVDLTPPTYYDRIDDAMVLAGTPGSAALVFESKLSDRESGSTYSLVTVPGRAAVDQLLTDNPDDEAGVSLDGLGDFDRLVRDGAREAADLFSAITHIEATVESSRLRFVPVAAVPTSLGGNPVAGTVFGLNEARDGYLAVLFDEPSALSVADAMLPVGGNGRFDEMTRSAIKEIGSVMTSGFLEGWADVFDEPIEHTAPAFANGTGDTVLGPVLRRIGTQREHTFLVDTTIRTEEGAIDCTILALPADHRLAELRSLRQPGHT